MQESTSKLLGTNKRAWMKLNKDQDDKLFSMILLLPTVFLVGVFIIYPIIDSIFRSFSEYTMKNMVRNLPATWNNFENYTWLFSNTDFINSTVITFIFVFGVLIFQFVLSMTLALGLNSNIKGARVLRSLMMLPWLVPTVISALIWMWIFQPQYGVFNYIAMLFTGGEPLESAILSNPATALIGVSVAALWKQIPLMTLLITAGLQSIPDDMYEAADIDGAHTIQKFFAITMPYLKPIIKTSVLMSIIDNFKQFPLFWNMTGGGPANSTTTLAVLSYKYAFVEKDLGLGAAVTTLWLIILLLVIFFYDKIFKIDEMS